MQKIVLVVLAAVLVFAVEAAKLNHEDDSDLDALLQQGNGLMRNRKRSVNFTPSWGKRSLESNRAFVCQQQKEAILEDLFAKLKVSTYIRMTS